MTTPAPVPGDFRHVMLDVHSGYRSGQMGHGPPDERVSESVTLGALRPHVARLTVLLTIAGVGGLLAWPLGFGAASFAMLFGADPATGLLVLVVCATLLAFALFVGALVMLVVPVRERIAEHGMLVEHRAAAADAAYYWIARTAQGRAAPLELRSVIVSGTPVLTLRSERVRAAVIVTPLGNDLYVGWTMWRRRSPLLVLGHAMRDLTRALSASPALAEDVRTARTVAVRELVHSVTREGVQAAIVGVPVPPEQVDAFMASLTSDDDPTGRRMATSAPAR